MPTLEDERGDYERPVFQPEELRAADNTRLQVLYSFFLDLWVVTTYNEGFVAICNTVNRSRLGVQENRLL